MQLTDLERHEQLALGGLVRILVRLDGSFAEEEEERMNRVADAIGGRDALWKCISDSAQELRTDDAARMAAERVVRPEARRMILDVLTDIARAGTITGTERSLLDWAATLWGLPTLEADADADAG